MKSLLLVLAISALIINQSYKKKAAAVYLGEKASEEAEPGSPAGDFYSPMTTYNSRNNAYRQTGPYSTIPSVAGKKEKNAVPVFAVHY